MRYALGVDIGGTNIRIAIVDESGKILEVIKEKTNKDNGINGLIDQIVNMYNKVPKTYNLEGIGLGIPGPCKKDGTVLYLTNLSIYQSYNYIELLKDRIPLPIYIGNDASVAGLAEAKVGNGVGYDVVQYLTLSTGIGGSLIIDGKMIEGKNGMAQEVGAMIIKNDSGIQLSNKPDGSIECLAGGFNLTNRANELGLNVKHTGELFALKETSEVAKKLYNDWISDIGAFIYSIYCYIEPDVFVLGGGMMQSKDLFLDDLVKHINDKYMPIDLKNTDAINIKVAKYDQDCGIIGAAMLCFK